VIAADVLRAQDLGKLESVVLLERAWMSGDPDLVERLVANLVSNAIRHNVAGGRIELATGVESGCAVLAVANTGPLVPPDELPRLFQPFQRLSASPRSLSDGVGLGLAIVDAIAAAHDAILTPRARIAGGLDFQVSFRATTVRRVEPRTTNNVSASGTGRDRRAPTRA
jgi:signal transduction histidine kinase